MASCSINWVGVYTGSGWDGWLSSASSNIVCIHFKTPSGSFNKLDISIKDNNNLYAGNTSNADIYIKKFDSANSFASMSARPGTYIGDTTWRYGGSNTATYYTSLSGNTEYLMVIACSYTSIGINTYSITISANTEYTVYYEYNDGKNGSASYDVTSSSHTIISTIPTYDGDYDNPSTFTITGYANGGDGGNKSVTATKRSYSIHTFLGWSTTDGATSATYKSGGTINLSGDTTLYGVWSYESGTSYTKNTLADLDATSWSSSSIGYDVSLIVNANNASVSPSTISSGIVTSHTFLGWNTDKNASSNLSPSTAYTKDTDVYAIWKTNIDDNSTIKLPTPTRENDTQNVEVSLDGNGGTTTTKSISTSIITTWTFKGWSTEKDASSGITGQYTPTSNVTLYATWSSSKSYPSVALPTTGLSKSKTNDNYTTYLNLNGGTHNISSVTTKYTKYWTFNYWSDSRTGSSVGTSISANNNYSKLYAIWKVSNTEYTTSNLGTPSNTVSFTVTFNANGGSVSPTSKSISGYYSFQGWYDSNGNKISNTESYRSNSNGNTLYATWSSAPIITGISLPTPNRSASFTVSFDPGTYANVDPISKSVSGYYTFSGWSTEKNNSNKIVSNTNYKPTSTHTLYAIWSSYPTVTGITLPIPNKSASNGIFTITLKDNGGILPSNITNPIEVEFNTSFTFAGWSTESGNSNNIVSNTDYKPTSTHTLYAIWTPDTNISGIKLPTSGIIKNSNTIDTYKIILNPIDGSVSVPYLSVNRIRNYTFKGWSPTGSTSNMVNSNNYIAKSDIELFAVYSHSDSTNSTDLPDAIKTDHTFLGWSTVEDDTNYEPKRYTPPGNITLYANYLANYRASLWIWYNGKWNKCIVNLFTGDRFNTAE